MDGYEGAIEYCTTGPLGWSACCWLLGQTQGRPRTRLSDFRGTCRRGQGGLQEQDPCRRVIH